MATSAQDTRLPAPDVRSTDPLVQTGAITPAPIPGEVRKIDEDQHIVGGITFRKSTREISFDAQVNQTGGLIEFLLVTEKGKIHESLFSCTISPTDLNLAFKLLGYPTSPELFEIVAPDHRPTVPPENTRKCRKIPRTERVSRFLRVGRMKARKRPAPLTIW
jgi:hypothetical protein